MGIFLKEIKKVPVFTGLLLKENCAEEIKLLIYCNNSKKLFLLQLWPNVVILFFN